MEVPRTPTPITAAEAAAMMREEFPRVFGVPLSPAVGELLLAQVWLETDRGRSMQCHNWGNITARESYPTIWRPTWYEITDASSERDKRLNALMLAGKAPRAFRAYPDHKLGLRDYLSQLKTRFPSIVAAARTGDAVATARAIHDSGYCPDCPPAATSQALALLREQFRTAQLFPGAAGGGGAELGDVVRLASAALLIAEALS